MLKKNSRYRDLPDVLTTDLSGREIKTKAFRCIPATRGVILHQVRDSDRLDLMAHKYYGDSEKWWKIIDANPGHLLPTELLNSEPFIVEDFWLEKESNLDHLPLAIRMLEESNGVRKTMVNRFEIDPPSESEKQDNSKEKTIAYRGMIQIEYNQNETDQYSLKKILESEGIFVKEVDRITKEGTKINIPAR